MNPIQQDQIQEETWGSDLQQRLEGLYQDFLKVMTAAAPGSVALNAVRFNTCFLKPAVLSTLSSYLGADVHRVSEALTLLPDREQGQVFAACVLASTASALFNQSEIVAARRMAERALSLSIYDLFVQEVYLRCHDEKALEATEDWLKTRTCEAPFRDLETTESGQLFVCCPLWAPFPVGDFSDTVSKITDSDRLRALRASVTDGSFKFCSRFHCTRITNRELPPRQDAERLVAVDASYPQQVVFSHDASCNLSCPSCRTSRITLSKSQQSSLEPVTEALLEPLMQRAVSVKVCGSGDPFASIHFRRLLKKYCASPTARPNLVLHTNGVLCDARAWEDIGLADLVTTVMVSTDAANSDSYRQIRRGGDWDRLKRNIQFISGLRRTGVIRRFEILFVVQGGNFREMPDAIEMAESAGADTIVFQAISNWGTYSEQDFSGVNIFSTGHPDHEAMLSVLELPCMKKPIVDLFSVAKFRRGSAAEAGQG